MLTLTGLGGVGKSRLALQAAGQNLSLFRDGIFFVPLSAVDSLESCIASITTALNFSLSGHLEPKIQLLNYLRSRNLLLILDNFEHLLPGSISSITAESASGVKLVADILQMTSQVKLLITSRERLNLQEEWVLEIEGLTYPINNEQLVINKDQKRLTNDEGRRTRDR